MNERFYRFIYKILTLVFVFVFPFLFLPLIKSEVDLEKYLYVLLSEVLLFVMSYFMLQLRFIGYYILFKKKLESKDLKIKPKKKKMKGLISFDPLINFDYFFSSEIDVLILKLDEMKKKIKDLEKENYTKYNLKEYQLRSAVQELEKMNERLKRKEDIMDNIILLIENLDRNDISYEMYFEELLYFINKHLGIEKVSIIRNKEGHYEIFSKHLKDAAISDVIIDKIKAKAERVIYKTEENVEIGHEIVLKLSTKNKEHGLLLIDDHFGEFLSYPILIKILNNLAIELSNIADKLYLIEQLKGEKQVLCSDIISLKDELKVTEDNLEAQLIQLTDMYEEIVTLYEVGKALVKIYDIKEIEKLILEMALDIVGAEVGVVYYYHENKNHPVISKLISIEELDEEHGKDVRLFIKEFLSLVDIRIKKSELLINAPSESEYLAQMPQAVSKSVRNIICVPIYQGKDVVGGVIVINKTKDEEFSAGNVNLMTAITNQLGMSVQNIDFLNKEIEIKKEEEQLKIASEIQSKLLPQEMPKVANYEFYGMNISAKAVGGDYYDLIKIDDHRTIGIIADVSGKGIPAALLVSMFRTIARMLILRLKETSPANIFAYLNDVVASEDIDGRFITSACFLLDNKKNKITIANAGHNPIMIYRADKNITEEIDTTGCILGIMENEVYEEVETTLGKGDIMVLYTDGITEAKGVGTDLFGYERLREIIEKNNKYPTDYIVRKVYREVQKYLDERPQNDDITIVAVKGI